MEKERCHERGNVLEYFCRILNINKKEESQEIEV
jgi:hypothetical protein